MIMKGNRDRYKQAATWLAMGLPLALPFYLLRFSIGPLPMTVLEVYLLAMVVLAAVGFGREGVKEAWKKFKPWAWPAGLFLAASLAAALWSPVIISGLGVWRAYVLEPLMVFFFLPILLSKPEQKKTLERNMTWVVLAVTLWAILQFAGALPIPSPWDVAIGAGRRATGPFPYPNALALFVVPFGVYLFARWINQQQERKYLAGTISAFIAALLANSDGGLIAFGVGIFAVLMMQAKLRKPVLALTLIALVAVMAIPVTRGKIIEQVTFQGWSGRVRVWMWDETRRMLMDHPITGAGMAGYPIVFKPYHEKTFIEIFQYPHNIILNFWSETGLVGLIAFGWIVVTWSRKRASWMMLAPLLAILVHGLVDVPYFKNDLAVAFWLLAFLTTMSLDREAVKR